MFSVFLHTSCISDIIFSKKYVLSYIQQKKHARLQEACDNSYDGCTSVCH